MRPALTDCVDRDARGQRARRRRGRVEADRVGRARRAARPRRSARRTCACRRGPGSRVTPAAVGLAGREDVRSAVGSRWPPPRRRDAADVRPEARGRGRAAHEAREEDGGRRGGDPGIDRDCRARRGRRRRSPRVLSSASSPATTKPLRARQLVLDLRRRRTSSTHGPAIGTQTWSPRHSFVAPAGAAATAARPRASAASTASRLTGPSGTRRRRAHAADEQEHDRAAGEEVGDLAVLGACGRCAWPRCR